MMNTSKSSLFAKFAGIVGVAIFAIAPAFAQTPGATVHGHVTNPAGQPFSKGDMKFTQDETVPYKDAKISNTAPIDR